MSRPGHRRVLTIAAATLVTLVAPAAASAATYTVKPGDGACGGGDLACGGLVEAAAAAAPGDIFNVATGTYPGAKFTVGGVTIAGDLGATINGTLEFNGAAGGVSTVSKVAISQGTAAAPALLVTGASGVQISDSVIASKDGDGVHIAAGTANKIVRTLVLTGGAQTSAVGVVSTTGTPAKGVTIESSILAGGGAGVSATTTNNALEAASGDITLNLRHITAAGSTNGIRLDSSKAQAILGSAAGNITANLTDSIALNNATTSYPGIAGIGANTATINVTRSIQAGDPTLLFLNPLGGNYRLRADSPAIGQGGVTPGESTTDIDGEDRSTAPTDLGADEFNPAAPTASFVVATKTPRNTQPVTFDGSASSDRDGLPITEYHWRYSDGKSDVTTTPTVQHVFADQGDAAAGLTVVDKAGVASPEVAVTFKLVDGLPPAVGIAKPKAGQTLHLYTTKTTTVTKNGKKTKVKKRTRTKIQIGGLSADASGVQTVLLTIEKVGATTKKTAAKSSAATTTRCHFYDPKKGFVYVSCAKPKLITARLVKDDKNGQWTYTIPSTRPLSAGSYRVAAYGVDKAGAFGNSADAKLGKISFKLVN
ncbi:MAG TPA: PKD domain-containing protein [Solirubrobacteraceae bacterium]|nr:PKD domain-containing protein [Solirubrobacteraceae bacterium]